MPVSNDFPTASPATPSEPKCHGFEGLACIKCGVAGNISIDLPDLTGSGSIHCYECDETFSLDEVREVMEAWAKVIAWVGLAPTL